MAAIWVATICDLTVEESYKVITQMRHVEESGPRSAWGLLQSHGWEAEVGQGTPTWPQATGWMINGQATRKSVIHAAAWDEEAKQEVEEISK